MKTDINIGFIGLGNVYSKFANSLLVADYNLFIYDLDKSKAHDLVKKGGFFCKNLKEIFLNSSIIITCLPLPKSVSKVIEGIDGIINHINSDHL